MMPWAQALFRRWSLCMGLLLLAPTLSRGATFEVPPFVGHNMVLQRDAGNVLWGKSDPREYVSAKYKNYESVETRADSQGAWSLELHTRGLDPKPGMLEFQLGRKKTLRTALVLTNVVIGDVLLIGSLKKGVPPTPERAAEVRSVLERLRFLDLPSVDDMRSHLSDVPAQWNLSNPATFELLSIQSFAWAVHVTRGYMGVIQTRSDELSTSYREHGARTEVKDRSRLSRLSLFQSTRDAANTLATNEVVRAMLTRNKILAQAKHSGVVTNLPIPVQLGWPTVRLYEEFDANAAPAALVTFDAAIW